MKNFLLPWTAHGGGASHRLSCMIHNPICEAFHQTKNNDLFSAYIGRNLMGHLPEIWHCVNNSTGVSPGLHVVTNVAPITQSESISDTVHATEEFIVIAKWMNECVG